MNTPLSASTRLAYVTAAAAAAMLVVAVPTGASASAGHSAYCIDRPSCENHLIWKRSEAWSGFQASGGPAGGEGIGSADPTYCVDRPSCASHMIWKRSEAWSGFQASAGIQGGQTDGFPWADVALGVGLACACALTLVGGICLRERSRARSHLLRSG